MKHTHGKRSSKHSEFLNWCEKHKNWIEYLKDSDPALHTKYKRLIQGAKNEKAQNVKKEIQTELPFWNKITQKKPFNTNATGRRSPLTSS